MFLRIISTSVQMILRCVGKERDAADVSTWNDRGRDGQEDHHHKKSHLATYENGSPGDDESGNRSRGS